MITAELQQVLTVADGFDMKRGFSSIQFDSCISLAIIIIIIIMNIISTFSIEFYENAIHVVYFVMVNFKLLMTTTSTGISGNRKNDF